LDPCDELRLRPGKRRQPAESHDHEPGQRALCDPADSRAIDNLLCLPSVLTDVTVELDSSGGAFHESFRGVLAASNADSATLSATLLGAHLAGSFAFDPATLAGRTLAQLNLNLSFGVGSFSSAISAGIEQQHGTDTNGAVSLENVPLACAGRAAFPGQAGCTE